MCSQPREGVAYFPERPLVPVHRLLAALGGHSHDHDHDGHEHEHGGGHGHSHGLVERSIMRSRAGLRAVAISLGILGLTALAQLAIFAITDSVALLADLVHNFGDAATAIPVCVALYETILRFIDPEALSNLGALALAGVIGFLGNEIAAQVRLRAGRRLASPALIADGNHARVDGFVSLGVVVSALGVALGFDLADPIVGLVITLVILKITWDSWRTVRDAEPGHVH